MRVCEMKECVCLCVGVAMRCVQDCTRGHTVSHRDNRKTRNIKTCGDIFLILTISSITSRSVVLGLNCDLLNVCVGEPVRLYVVCVCACACACVRACERERERERERESMCPVNRAGSEEGCVQEDRTMIIPEF